MKRLLLAFCLALSTASMAYAHEKPKPVVTLSTYILLDRTGSMSSIWDEALKSVNAYAEDMRNDMAKSHPNTGSMNNDVTLAVFDAQNGLQFDVLRRHADPRTWRPVTNAEANPRGMTPLYDAVGQMIAMAEKDAPKRAVIVIMTDGAENASREMTAATTKAALDRAKKRGWEVVFLGAEFANFKDAEALGNSSRQNMAVSKEGLKPTMERLAQKNRAYAKAENPASAPVTFDAEDRAAAQEDKVKDKK